MFFSKTFSTVLWLSFLSFGCSPSKQAVRPQLRPVSQDERLAKIKMTSLDGMPIKLGDFAGRPVFLNFWATWCGPCVSEMASIEKASQQFKGQITFLALSNETPAQIQSYIKKHQLSFQFGKLEGTYLDAHVVVLPTTILIDASGKIVSEEEGFRDWSNQSSLNKLKALLEQ